MVGLLMTVFLVLIVLGIINCWDEDACLFYACGFVICLIICACLGGSIINGRTLDRKIQMYTEQNKTIEEDMNTLVKQYMNYESGTYGELKSESSITLVSLYPDLKADALVTKQIEVYIDNNEKIKNLKEKCINISNYKWWLYFGG